MNFCISPEDQSLSGIYKITNILTKKVYIGQARSLIKRYKEHKKLLTGNKHYNEYLQAAYNKYGGLNFNFSLIEKFEFKNESKDTIRAILNHGEQRYIDHYIENGAINKNLCYNIGSIASSTLGYKHTEKTKEKMMGKVGALSPRSKIVYQFDFAGNLIKEYNGSKEAQRETKINSNHIRECCAGARISAGNFIWFYKEFFKKETLAEILVKNIKKHKVESKMIVSIEIKTGKETSFKTIASAAEALGIHRSSISKILSGNRKEIKGYKFCLIS